MDEAGAMGPNPINLGTGRVLFAAHTCYFDSHNGASVASRSMMECLWRHGFSAAAMSGTVLESAQDLDPIGWLAEQGMNAEPITGKTSSPDVPGPRSDSPLAYRLQARGVPVLLHRSPTTHPHQPDESECREFLGLFEGVLDEFRPDVVINFGGDALAAAIRHRARIRGAAVVFALHNFSYWNREPFEGVDAVIVPSRFAASYYRRTLGIECRPLPNLVDFERIRVAAPERRYVTFVNPSYEKGVYAFVRIADELGRRRPDIPLLVVESRGTERTLVDCGIDLRVHGNVTVMSHTSDPRRFWRVTKVCLLPSLWWENQPLVAIEALANGIPVIGSDRGGIPEALGDSGIVLGLPPRLLPSSRELPTAEQVAPWVKAVIGLWDDPAWYEEQSRRALAAARRWAPEALEPQYVRFFDGLRSSACKDEEGGVRANGGIRHSGPQ
jgi:glycosyltransferase involved in cell wall biosynthesis